MMINKTIKELIEDMTEDEKEKYNFLVSAKTENYPNLKEKINDFWEVYFYDRKSPLYEHGYLDK